MLRFILLCILILLLYYSFNMLIEYNAAIQILVMDYQIEVKLFTVIAAFILLQLLFIIAFKVVFLLLDIPQIIKRIWNRKKLNNLNEKLVSALSELLMNNRNRSFDFAKKALSYSEINNKNFKNLVFFEISSNFEEKISHLESLLDKKHYSVYASRKLAELFFDAKKYDLAEKYANKSFNEDDTDPRTMFLLVRIYGTLMSWSKLVLFVSKLKRANSRLLFDNAQEIVDYYYLAAKSLLNDKKDQEAMTYLEYALEICPAHIESLNLFAEISENFKNKEIVIEILKSAFSINPSFEIARIYLETSKDSPEIMYRDLSSIVSPKEYLGLFLSIAAYLGMKEKIEEINSLNQI